MYAVKFTKMFMPVTMFFATKELAEAMKKKIEKEFPGIEVVIEG